MATRPTETVDAFLCFDANLPKIEKCQLNCGSRTGILCAHRFKGRVFIEHCNTKKFQGWSDLRIFTYFLGKVLENVAEGLTADNSTFIILTKDRNFIDDIREEWARENAKSRLELKFHTDAIVCGGLTVFVCQIDCPNYGNKRTDDLKCAFYKVNNFLSEQSKA